MDDRKKELVGRAYEKLNGKGSFLAFDDRFVPKGFVTDMHHLFGIDPAKDVARNFILIGDSSEWYIFDNLLLPESVKLKELLVKLADYVAGTKTEIISAISHVQGPDYQAYDLRFGDPKAFVYDMRFLCDDSLPVYPDSVYRANQEADFGEELGIPSAVAIEVKEGKHFRDEFWLCDERLI